MGGAMKFKAFVHEVADRSIQEGGVECKLFVNKEFANYWSNRDYRPDTVSKKKVEDDTRFDVIPDYYRSVYIVFTNIPVERGSERVTYTWSLYDFANNMAELVEIMGDDIWLLANFITYKAANEVTFHEDECSLVGNFKTRDEWNLAIEHIREDAAKKLF